MTFKLSSRSIRNMKGVREDIVGVAEESITLTPVDFGILDNGGLRTASMQKALYNRGASKLDGRNRLSKHQKQVDGFGWALDLVPYFGGSYRWEWSLIYPVVATVAIVAQKRDVKLRWGGIWDRVMEDYAPEKLSDIDKMAAIMKDEVYKYTVRHPGPDFIDGPHYELLV